MAYNIIQHLKYNAWANHRIATVVDPVDEQIIFMENKSSFPSIAKTLLHIWDAELVWLKRMQGTSLNVFPSTSFKGDKQELLRGFVDSSKSFLTFIESQGNDFLAKSYSYKNMKGDEFTDVVEDTLYHVVNHGTYHRGQVTTMLREAGITNLVSTDLIHYLRSAR